MVVARRVAYDPFALVADGAREALPLIEADNSLG